MAGGVADGEKVSMDHQKLLEETMSFHQGLIRYGNLLRDERSQEQAARLRTDLSVQFGRIVHPLSKHGLTRYYRTFGRTFPLFETALQPLSDWPGPNFEAIGLSVQTLEHMIGVLREQLENPSSEGSVGPFVFGALAVAGLIGFGWLFGRRQDEIAKWFTDNYARTIVQLFSGNRPWLVSSGITSVIAGGLFVNLIHERGLSAWRIRPFSTALYLLLTIAAGIGAVLFAR